MNQHEQKELFLDSTTRELTRFYNNEKQCGQKDMSVKYRIEGFMCAGVVLELSSNEELTKLMEGIYFEVFGVTPAERKLQKTLGDKNEVDWTHYDTHPSLR
jgi:hypothetical protein